MKKLFSLIALAGALVACQPENIETAFVVDDAVATINVTCVDITTGATVTPVLTADYGTVSGQKVTLTGTPALESTVVTVKAPYQGAIYGQSVVVNALRAGAVANYNLLILVGEAPGDWKLSIEPQTVVYGTPVKSQYKPNHAVSHNYSHNGVNYTSWSENDSEWVLEADVTYPVYTGYECTKSDVKIINKAFTETINLLAGELIANAGLKETKATKTFSISAWSLYLAFSEMTPATQDFNIYATNDNYTQLVATVTTRFKNTTNVDVLEIAHPTHGHSYIHGHGHTDAHGHGTTSANAGGGIVYAE